MSLAFPWALLALGALPALWILYRRRARPPQRDVPALLFFVEEAGPLLAAHRRRHDLALWLSLAAAALLSLAAAGPEVRVGSEGRRVRVVVAGGAPAGQTGYADRVERALAALRAGVGPDDRVEVLAWPGAGALPSPEGPRPSPAALAAAARAGAPGLAVVLSDVLPDPLPADVRWIAVGEAATVNVGIVAVDLSPGTAGRRLLATVLNHARSPAEVEVVVRDLSAAREAGRRRLRLGPDEGRAVLLDLDAAGPELEVRLVPVAGPVGDGLGADDVVRLSARPLTWAGGGSGDQATALGAAFTAAGATPGGAADADVEVLGPEQAPTPPAGPRVRWALRLGRLGEGTVGVHAPSGPDQVVPHALTCDLSTVGVDLVFADEPVGPPPPGTLLAREAGGRTWPVLVLEDDPPRTLRVVPDLTAGAPSPAASPLWPLIVENLLRAIGGSAGPSGVRAQGLLDPASTRLGRSVRPFDPQWLAAVPVDHGPRPVRLAAWLATMAVALLLALWLLVARLPGAGGYARGVPLPSARTGALLATIAMVLSGVACGRRGGDDDPAAKAEQVTRWLKEAPEKAHAVLATDARSLKRHAARWTPDLVVGLSSPDAGLRAKAADALGGLGASGVDAGAAVIAATRDADVGVRRSAVRALALLAPAAPGLVAALAAALNDDESDVRLEAVGALAVAAATDGEALPALVQALADPDEEVVDHAIGRLGLLGAPCVPCLIEALQSKKATFVRCAAITLARLGDKAAPAREALEDLLRRGSGPLRAAGAVALGRLGKEALPSLPRLRTALDDAEEDVAERASQALHRLAFLGPDALRQVLEGLRDPRPRVRAGTLQALVGVDGDRDAVLAAIRPAFADADRGVRFQAVQVVLAWRLDAEGALDELRGMLEDPDLDVRTEVVLTLGVIARRRPELIETLGALLQSPAAEVRATTAHVLESLGPRAKPQLARLLKALDDPSSDVRYFALLSLKSFGADSLPAREKLVEHLGDPHMPVRREAAATLGQHGPAGAPSVAALVAALADAHPDVREAAAGALGRLGPTAREAATALERLGQDAAQSREVRQAAQKAFEAVRRGS